MAINRTDITVESLDALVEVHVAELRDGANAWITSIERYAVLHKVSGLTPDGVTVFAPAPGSPIAGGALSVWVLGDGSGGGGRTFIERLESDASISTAPPTAPLDYGPGQPATLVTMTESFRAGRVLMRGSVCGFVGNDAASAVDENQAFADVGLFVDGTQVGTALQSFFFEQQPTAFAGPGKFYGFSGTVEEEAILTEGSHTIEIRWGVTGAGPHASAFILVSTPPTGNAMQPDFATLVVQEI